MTSVFKVGFAALVAAGLGMPAFAADITLKFSHVVAPDTPKGKAAAKFEELAEKYTNGKVDVEVYPNSQLYKDKEELEALQLGSVQMLAPSLAKFGPLGASEFELFDLPYLFDGYDDLRKVTEGDVGQELLHKLDDKGITGLAYWDNGFKIMSANSPLHRARRFPGPEDAHPVVQDPRGGNGSAWRAAAGHGVLGSVPGRCRPASSTAPKTRPRTCTPRRCTRCRSTPRCRTTAIWATR